MPLDPKPEWLLQRRQEIGARIRTTRNHAGLSQLQLGQLIGRDHRTIHRWEYAERIPDLDDLLLLANALNIPITELVQRAAPADDGGDVGRGPEPTSAP